MKGSTATRWPLLSSQINGLSEYQRRASQLLYRALPPQRQRGRQETARAWRQWVAAISTPDTMSSTKLWAGSHLLTCLPGILDHWHLPGLSQPEISIPDETHSTPGTVLSWCTWEPEWWGLGIWVRCTAHMGQCARQAWSPELFRPGKGTECTANPCLCPGRAAKNLSGLDLGSAWNAVPRGTEPLQSNLETKQCTPGTCTPPWTVANTVWSIHYEYSPYMPVVFVCMPLAPHSTAEQVSLNKWPRLPPCVRVQIRHWSDLQTAEAKTNKEGGTATD